MKSSRRVRTVISSAPMRTASPCCSHHAAAAAHAAGELPRLNILPGSLTVSGVSAGGYMATQYQVAFSKDVSGAGIIGAGPWLLRAGRHHAGIQRMPRGQRRRPGRSMRWLRRCARAPRPVPSTILPGSCRPHLALPRQAGPQSWAAVVSDSLLRFYLANFVPRERIRYETQVAAAHGFPTKDSGAACDSSKLAMDPRLRFRRCGRNAALTCTTACASLQARSRASSRVRPGAATSRRANPFRRCTRRDSCSCPRTVRRRALPDPRRLPWLSTGHRLSRQDLRAR